MFDWFMRNIRRPTSFLGKLIGGSMNQSHNQRTDWGLSHVDYGEDYMMLDVGCGDGKVIKKLASRAPFGKIYGVDVSVGSVRDASNVNRDLISSGHVEILESGVSSLPFENKFFDVVTALEIHYDWPDLVENMKEIYRVLVPYGKFLVVGGEYLGSRFDDRNKEWAEDNGLILHTLPEFKETLEKAGFTEVEIFEEQEKGWFCSFARRPWK